MTSDNERALMHLAAAADTAMRAHGTAGFPLEVCGFLVGRDTPAGRDVRDAWPVRNAWEDDPELRQRLFASLEAAGAEKSAGDWESAQEERRFLVSPQDQLHAMRRARQAGMDLVGVYHTHPNHPAVPSGYDRDLAWPGWSYVILSVRDGIAEELRSWTLDEAGQFAEEPIVLT